MIWPEATEKRLRPDFPLPSRIRRAQDAAIRDTMGASWSGAAAEDDTHLTGGGFSGGTDGGVFLLPRL